MDLFTISEAKKREASTIAKIWQQIDAVVKDRPFGGDTESKVDRAIDIIAHAINSPNAQVLVAKQDEEIIGTITGHAYTRPAVHLSSVGVMYSLWVAKKYRKQGIGQALLDAIEKHLIEMGVETFQVGWDTQNTYAAQWWQKRGYVSYETIASKKVNPN